MGCLWKLSSLSSRNRRDVVVIFKRRIDASSIVSSLYRSPTRQRRCFVGSAKSESTSTWSTLPDEVGDGLDGYRKNGEPTEEILQRIHKERQRFLQQGRINPRLYQEVYLEILQAHQQQAKYLAETESSWAMGPTGQFSYRWTTTMVHESADATTKNEKAVDTRPQEQRVYQRMRHLDVPAISSLPQNLISLKEETSLLSAPSLSVDETYVAHVELDSTDESAAVIIFNTETKQRHKLQQPQLPTGCRQVEWGYYDSVRDVHVLYSIHAAPSDGRTHQIWKSKWSSLSKPGEIQAQPQLVWSVADDPTLYLHVQRSKGGQYVILQAQSLDSNEVYLVGPEQNDDNDESKGRLVAARVPGRLYHVDAGADGEVFVLIHDATKGHFLVETTVDQLPLPDDIFDHQSSTGNYVDRFSVTGHCIQEIDLYRYWLVLYEVDSLNGQQRVRVVDRRTPGEQWVVPTTSMGVLPTFQPVNNAYYDSTSCYIKVDSPIEPASVYEYCFVSRRLEHRAGPPTTARPDYEAERVTVSSHDGTLVPLSILSRRDCHEKGHNEVLPVVLTAYGAYGRNVDMSCNPIWQTLLNKGYTIAWAHVREGGERGVVWHNQGRRANKLNSIEDYLACAKALDQSLLGTDRPVRLIAKAFSAGGVSIASAVNRDPNVFDTVVLTNAFLDVYATMRNPNLPLTEHEWDEYANPLESKEIDELIRSYCPVQTAVQATEWFPRTLLVAALQDSMVPYWNALVYAEALRRKSNQKISVLIEDGVDHDLGEKIMHISAIEVAYILSDGNSEN